MAVLKSKPKTTKRRDRGYMFIGPSGAGKSSAAASWLEHGDLDVIQTDTRGKEDPYLEAIGIGLPHVTHKEGLRGDGTRWLRAENPKLFGGRCLRIWQFFDRNPREPTAFDRAVAQITAESKAATLVVDSSTGLYDHACQKMLVECNLDRREYTYRNLATNCMEEVISHVLPGLNKSYILITHVQKRYGIKSESKDRGSMGGDYTPEYIPNLSGRLSEEAPSRFSEVYYFHGLSAPDEEDEAAKEVRKIQTRASGLYYANTSASMRAPNMERWVELDPQKPSKRTAFRVVHATYDTRANTRPS